MRGLRTVNTAPLATGPPRAEIRRVRAYPDPPRHAHCAPLLRPRRQLARRRAAAEPTPIRGFTAAVVARRARRGRAKFRAIPDPARMRDIHAAPLRASASRRLAVRQAERRVDPRPVRELRLGGAQIETFDVLFPTPMERVRRAGRADDVHGEAAGADRSPAIRPPRSTPSSSRPTTPTRSTATSPGRSSTSTTAFPADYEELERRGISVKGAIVIARYGGSWRGIKPKVAAEHGAIGCLIYSDPARRRLRRRRRLSRRARCARRGRAARQRAGHADVSRRSAHAGRRRDEGRQASALSPRRRRSRRSRCCRSRTATRSRCSRRSRRPVAPARGAAGCRSRTASAPAPARVHLKRRSPTGPQAAVRRHRAPPRHRPSRRVGHPRQSPRRVGERRRGSDLRSGRRARGSARARRAVQAGLASEAHDHLRRVGRRGAGAARLDRVGRDARRRAARSTRSRTSTATRNGRGFLGVEGSHTLEQFINGVARDIDDPETERQRRGSATQAAAIATARADERARRATRGDLRIGALGSGSDYTPFLQHLGVAVAEPRLRRRG